MLDLGYPGGPVIARIAEEGDPDAYPLPRPMSTKPGYDFSFSGLKTAALYNTNDLRKSLGKGFAKIIPDYCASVQEAIVDSIVRKASKAMEAFSPRMIITGGGVMANKRLRVKLRREAKRFDVPIYFPTSSFATDNGAMIALVARW
jgi:N6-L-threonylcarbamoyladenine synthase